MTENQEINLTEERKKKEEYFSNYQIFRNQKIKKLKQIYPLILADEAITKSTKEVKSWHKKSINEFEKILQRWIEKKTGEEISEKNLRAKKQQLSKSVKDKYQEKQNLSTNLFLERLKQIIEQETKADNIDYQWQYPNFLHFIVHEKEPLEKHLQAVLREAHHYKQKWEEKQNLITSYLSSHPYYQNQKWLDKEECLQKAEKWWIEPKPKERKQIYLAKSQEELKKVWEEANNQRAFGNHLLLIAFCVLVFFGWDKFWAWYKKPLDDEWGWDDDEEDDEDEKKEVKVVSAEPKTPQPKTWWEWIKSNKIRMTSLIVIVCVLLSLGVKVGGITFNNN